jgi:hypothetical protein
MTPMQMTGRDDPSSLILREALRGRATQRLAPSAEATQHRVHAFCEAGPPRGGHARFARRGGARGAGRLRAEQSRAGAGHNERAAPSLRRRRRRAHSRLSVRRERVPASSLRDARGRGAGRFNRRRLCVRLLQVAGRHRDARGWLPRASLELVAPAPAPARQWDGNWQRDREARIVIKSHGDEVEVSGSAMWGSYDPERVRRGGVHVGELSGTGRPRGQTLAIGYDPDRSSFRPAQDQPPEDCAAKLDLYGRYLVVEDNRGCGGLNVSFTGTYVRVNSFKRQGRM